MIRVCDDRPENEGPGRETCSERIVRLEAALRDFAQLLPPERWRLLRDSTNDTLAEVQARDRARAEGLAE